MKNFFIILMLFTFASNTFALDVDEQIESAVKSFTDRTHYKIQGLSRTPTPGLFVMNTNNGIQLTNFEGKLLYSRDKAFYADNKGEITGDALNEIRLEALSEIDPESIIVIKHGDGSKKIILDSALDCPFCLKQEKILAKEKHNATLYLIPTVLDKANWPILEKVMCSDDRAKAWTDYMLHKSVPKNDGKCYWSDNYSYIGTAAYSSNVLRTVGTPQMLYGDGIVQSFTEDSPLGRSRLIADGDADIFNPITIITSYFSKDVYTPPKKSFFGF